MIKIHSIENTELTPYCLRNLEKNGIIFVREFNSEKPETLMEILNINLEQVLKIKKEFRRLYGPKPCSFTQFFKENLLRKAVYNTHITNLDNLLAPQELFNSLSFWEICGPAGVGKTQLALTLILNFIINQVSPVLFIDTKLDFSASRIKNMLEARGIEPEQYAGIMSFIKVERVLSAQGVVEMLEEFYKQLQEGNQNVNLIKMIVIDSLPAAWFLLKANSNRLSAKYLLSRLSQIINRLVGQYYIAVVCINLSLIPSQEENRTILNDRLIFDNDNDICDLIDADDRELDNENVHPTIYRPALGNFWLSKPHTRLSVEFPDEEDVQYKEDSSLRIIKVIHARFLPCGIRCSVRLQSEGVI